MHLAYDGTDFHGWQKQNNAHTVQGEIENRLGILLKKETGIMGAGRTDTGVHAKNFFAHFDSERLDRDYLASIVHKLNSFLPSSIAVYSIKEVSLDLHARFSAFQRSYEYHLHTQKDPFLNRFSHYMPQKLDVDKMNEAARLLIRNDDFTSFSKTNTQVHTHICDVQNAFWIVEGHRMVFYITADRFLRNMVRAIVGTLIEVGLNRREVEDIDNILQAKKRSEAGFSVPAHGLFLSSVKYPDDR